MAGRAAKGAGCQAVSIMYMDHVGSKARYASCTMICSRWARRPDMQGRQAVCIMYMDHIRDRFIWARRPDMRHVP
jgi:hypothetical protein